MFDKNYVFDDLCFISFDLIVNTILKELSLRKDISNYALVINREFYKKSKNIDKLNKKMGKLKKNVFLLISYIEYVEDEMLMNKIRELGFEILVDAHRTDKLNFQKINKKDKVITNRNYENRGNSNIIVIDDGRVLNENQLLNIRISEELN